VKRRSYVTNAQAHAGNRVIRSVDVRKYFPSTKARRVYWFFHDVLKCERDLAGLLTHISTYREHLPTGSPLSPIMSFFAHHDVWEGVAAFCVAEELTLTVYIDDCTVSGKHVSNSQMWEIKKLIHRSGLRYHKEKTYIDMPAEVTGVVVRNGTIRTPNRQLLKLRNAKKELAENPHVEELQKRVGGLRGQIHQIENPVPLG
jgi:hypothetical protein